MDLQRIDTDAAVPLNGSSPPGIILSLDVADYLLQVLNSVQLPVATPDFEAQAAIIVRAKQELQGGINA